MGSSTEVQPTQANRNLGIIGVAQARKPVPVDDILIRQCNSFLEAIHLCIHLSKLPHWRICEQLGIDRGHWTRIMQGQAHFPTNKMHELIHLCGNFAPLQWLSNAVGVPLAIDEKARRRAELMRELELLDVGPSIPVSPSPMLAAAA